eukprot:Rhum_TRINITY_DN14473_c10_g1::Rhum_TRINITY_DN14473_c10_g1_i1::g.93386::m.93386
MQRGDLCGPPAPLRLERGGCLRVSLVGGGEGGGGGGALAGARLDHLVHGALLLLERLRRVAQLRLGGGRVAGLGGGERGQLLLEGGDLGARVGEAGADGVVAAQGVAEGLDLGGGVVQQLLELLDLRHLGLLELVLRRVELDSTGTHGVGEGGCGLGLVGVARRDHCEHQSLAVPPKVLRQQPCQLRLPQHALHVLHRHARRKAVQRLPERQERLVDVRALPTPLPLHPRPRQALRPRQVDELHVRHKRRLRGRLQLLEGEDHNHVRPRRQLVHPRRRRLPRLHAAVEQLHGVLAAVHLRLDGTHHDHALLRLRILDQHHRLVADRYALCVVLLRGVRAQEVPHLLVVDLKHRHGHRDLHRRVLLQLRLPVRAQVREEAGQNAVFLRGLWRVCGEAGPGDAHQRVRLARAGLAIREEARVVAVHGVVHHRPAARVVDALLVAREDGVEREVLGALPHHVVLDVQGVCAAATVAGGRAHADGDLHAL